MSIGAPDVCIHELYSLEGQLPQHRFPGLSLLGATQEQPAVGRAFMVPLYLCGRCVCDEPQLCVCRILGLTARKGL